MDILRRERSFSVIEDRDRSASWTRTMALFYVKGDPATFRNRLTLPDAFNVSPLGELRRMGLVTLPDGRRGVEGDQ